MVAINCTKSTMWTKQQPRYTFASQSFSKARQVGGTKVDKHRVTLLLGSNATGEHALKPLLIYKYKNPHGIPRESKAREQLPVYLESQSNSWMTSAIFEDWILSRFMVEVEEFQRNRGETGPIKALLIFDNAPVHKTRIHEAIPELQIVLLPPNTTSLLQPQDQTVNRSYKAAYVKLLMQNCIEAEANGIGTSQFFSSFGIAEAIPLISQAWKCISQATLKNAWKNLLPWAPGNTESITRTNIEALEKEIKALRVKHSINFMDYLTESDCDLTDLETLTAEDLVQLNSNFDSSQVPLASLNCSSSNPRDPIPIDISSSPKLNSSATNESHIVDAIFLQQLPKLINLFNNSDNCEKENLISVVNNLIYKEQ
jgi:hypothetical protein